MIWVVQEDDLMAEASIRQAKSLMTIAAGTRLGRYEIRSQLGAGGMGEVYLVWDTQLDRKLALKILPVDVSNRERMRRFIQEAKAASALSHPNIAHVYEIGETNSISFIAMEYVEGQTLDLRISGRPLDPAEIIDTCIQVANALEEAHTKGITHRDIKPSNIIISTRNQVKVLDFGLAKVARPAEQAAASDIATQVKTSPGMVRGLCSI
jgi:serine/threonine protein kinase